MVDEARPIDSHKPEKSVARRCTSSRDRSRARSRDILERGVDGERIKVSIRCAFRSLSVGRSTCPFRRFAFSRVSSSTPHTCVHRRTQSFARDRPLVRKLHLSETGRLLARSPLSPCFFRCLQAPPENRKYVGRKITIIRATYTIPRRTLR